jgi:hypothetical protein
MTNWIGKWRNQYGSILEVTEQSSRELKGAFRTALPDSGFYGQVVPLVGVHQGDCISLAGGGKTAAGDAIVSYTGLLRDGRMETLWYVVADAAIVAPCEGAPGRVEKLNWWRSVSTSADTFARINESS